MPHYTYSKPLKFHKPIKKKKKKGIKKPLIKKIILEITQKGR